MQKSRSLVGNIIRIIGKIIKFILITVVVLILLAVLTVFSVDRWVAWKGGRAIMESEEA